MILGNDRDGASQNLPKSRDDPISRRSVTCPRPLTLSQNTDLEEATFVDEGVHAIQGRQLAKAKSALLLERS